MKKETPPYVVRLKGVLYFKRRGWPTLRLESQNLDAHFHAEYARILNGTAPDPKAFVVKGLVSSYYKSQKFESLKPRTKGDYRKFLSHFENNAGDIIVKSIKRKNVIAWRDQLAKTHGAHFANYFVRVLRILFRYAGDIDELPIGVNPAQGVESVKYDRKTPLPWPKDMIAAARAARGYEDRTRLLFELLYCTGQRVGDVLVMQWADIRGDAMHVSQNKTKSALVIPLTDDLSECLRRATRDGANILTKGSKGLPWSYRGAHAAMMSLRKEIGAEAYNIHAIRHTVASEIGASGSDDEVASITGHTTTAMVRHYAGAARQEARAKNAQKKRT